MSRALVAIGVSRCGSLRELPGAIEDAERMAEWARSLTGPQAYQFVRAFTDENGGKVAFDEIYDWIEDALSHGDLERLIISYSGHGYAPLPGHEVWLLSDWEDNGNEAIHASGSITYAQGYEWPQISFFADACRTTWSTPAPPLGQILLPRPGSRPAASQVDQFYATRFGFAAQEVRDDEQIVRSFGVFSRELRAALDGRAAIVRDGVRVVTSRSLEEYLDEAVPEASGRLAGVVQQPDTIPQWRKPHDIYALIDEALPKAIARGPAIHDEARPSPPPFVRKERRRTEKAVQDDARRIVESEGRRSFETGSGATILGARPMSITPDIDHDLFEENGAWHVRSREAKPSTVLVELEREGWDANCFAALSLYPGLIATVLVEDEGVSSLNYMPPWRPWHGEQADVASLDATQALAEATAHLRHGMMLPDDRLGEIVEILRRDKAHNPALAIIAANLAYRMGDRKTVNDIARYEIGLGRYTPFDLAVLATELPTQNSIVGAFPLLSATWAALAASELEVDPELSALIPEIRPSLWTTATRSGAEQLVAYLEPAAHVEVA